MYDFKFIKDLRTPLFALTVIERAFINDEKFPRYRNMRKMGVIQDGKDVITSNLDLQSVL